MFVNSPFQNGIFKESSHAKGVLIIYIIMVDVTSINIIGEIDTIFDFMQDMNKINLWSLGVKLNNNNH